MMTSDLDCEREQPCGVLSTGPSTIERSERAQVVREVGTGHAVEAAQPLLESTLVGVDVLDVPRAAHPLAFGQVDRQVLDVERPGGAGQQATAVGAQHGRSEEHTSELQSR